MGCRSAVSSPFRSTAAAENRLLWTPSARSATTEKYTHTQKRCSGHMPENKQTRRTACKGQRSEKTAGEAKRASPRNEAAKQYIWNLRLRLRRRTGLVRTPKQHRTRARTGGGGAAVQFQTHGKHDQEERDAQPKKSTALCTPSVRTLT